METPAHPAGAHPPPSHRRQGALQPRGAAVDYSKMDAGGTRSVRALADLIGVLSSAPDAESAFRATVRQAAAALTADGVALVDRTELLATAGGREGPRSAELVAAARQGADEIDVPGKGRYVVATTPVDHLRDGWLVVARPDDRPYADEERHLLRGMSRALALSVRSLDVVAHEVRLCEEAERNAAVLASWEERQKLLERLSRIQRSILARAPLDDVLTAIVTGAAGLLGDEVVGLRRINPDKPGWVQLVASAGLSPELVERLREGRVGEGVGGRAVAEGRLVVAEDYADSSVGLAELRHSGLRSAMAAPVHENGEVVGSLVVASRRTGRRYSGAEQETLVAFADHASLAMTDAETVRALHRALDTATHDALHDSLTGLANRALLNDRLAQALRRSSRREGGFAMLYLDLDGFKRINDGLGHEAGDRLLIAVANRLAGCVRANDTTARLGGDEFAILLEDVSDQGEAERAGDRILASLREPFTLTGQDIRVDASIGIADVKDVSGPEDLLRNADLAMYEAKAAGKGRHRRFEPDMHVRSLARLDLETALRRAVEEDQLVVHYQPIVALEGGAIAGTEALVRWRHPERGLLRAAEFLPVAKSTGLVLPIDRWVLTEACRQAKLWQDSSTAGVALWASVNISGRQFQEPRLVEQVTSALDLSGLAPRCLVLELTADVLLGDVSATLRTVARLHEVGVRVAIDDFGTGQSSLDCLRRFPIDIVKIDKSFIDKVAHGTGESRLAQGIVSLARALGYQTVAEGIEYAEQADALRAFGCDLGQGHHFARPCAPEQLGAVSAYCTPQERAPLAC